MEAFQYILVGFIGSLGQIVDGVLGMGFGLIASSSMMALGFIPAAAVATINLAKIVTGLASGLSHWRFGNVKQEWLIPLTAGGLIGGIVGALLLTSIEADRARFWTGIILLVMAGLVIWRSIRWKVYCIFKSKGGECVGCPVHSNGNGLFQRNKNHARLKLGGLGFLAAFINGLTGAYGPLATTGVLLLEKGEPRKAIGTVNLSEFFVALVVSLTIITRMDLKNFSPGLALSLALGGIVIAPAAAYICRTLSPRVLTLLVGITVIGMNVVATFLLF